MARFTVAASVALLAACADSNGVGGDDGCDLPPTMHLAPGEHAIVDASANRGCIRLPEAGADSAEYLVVGYSANGDETPEGVSGSYELILRPASSSAALLAPQPELRPTPSFAFHSRLRARERQLADTRQTFAAWLRTPLRPVPPAPGSTRSFKVCATRACDNVVEVGATAKYVGAHAAIYLDSTVPAGGYTDSELDSLGLLFDTQLYPIDTTAFGRESDVDGNGVVAILLSDQVNALSPTCASNGQLVPGYFTGQDLLDVPNSNHGEVFYAIVPDPAVPLCFSKSVVQRFTGPTFIHEFQHMISFNRHVLLAGGTAEDTWLNEGLSLLAEELGGRQVAAGFCAGGNCLNQYAASNLRNAAQYLQSPVATYVVEPGTSAGTLAERGANWLFVRWLSDQAPGDSLLGRTVSRQLLGADGAQGVALNGGANVAAAASAFDAGVDFASLLGQWHLANFAETRTALPDASTRLRYKSWNLRSSIDAVQPGPYPLVPVVATEAGVARSGTLRGGSGDYVRVLQGSGDEAITVRLTSSNGGTVQPHLAVVRLR